MCSSSFGRANTLRQYFTCLRVGCGVWEERPRFGDRRELGVRRGRSDFWSLLCLQVEKFPTVYQRLKECILWFSQIFKSFHPCHPAEGGGGGACSGSGADPWAWLSVPSLPVRNQTTLLDYVFPGLRFLFYKTGTSIQTILCAGSIG